MSWEKARLVIRMDQEAAEHPEVQKLKPHERHKRLNLDLNRYWEKRNQLKVQTSFMSHARRIQAVWPEVIGSGTNILPYQHYRLMAACSLTLDQKQELRNWAERELKLRREVLRQEIRNRVDEQQGVSR